VARRRVTDYLQSHNFWLLEISASARAPLFVAGALTNGFQSITMPELSADAQSFSPLNSYYPEHYYTSFSVGAITLSRGVTAFDSTFYRWIRRSVSGEDRVQRNLLLLHFAGLGVGEDGEPIVNASAPGIGAGNLETIRAFGKGYILWDCIPTRYKAGSDLDATSGEVSIAELDIQPHYFTEFSLDPRQITDLI
jgi:hypothetical protein